MVTARTVSVFDCEDGESPVPPPRPRGPPYGGRREPKMRYGGFSSDADTGWTSKACFEVLGGVSLICSMCLTAID